MSSANVSTEIDSARYAIMLRERHVSPLVIGVLLHCHARCEPLPQSGIHSDTVKWFLEEGIIEAEPENFNGCGYVTTGRGRKWVEMILATPMPVKRWLDPRNPLHEDMPVAVDVCCERCARIKTP